MKKLLQDYFNTYKTHRESIKRKHEPDETKDEPKEERVDKLKDGKPQIKKPNITLAHLLEDE